MHIQILNPNSQPDTAAQMARLIAERCREPITIGCRTLEHAPAYLDTPDELAAMLPDILSALEGAVPPPDLALVACFSDIRRELAENHLSVPVFTIADLSILSLGTRGLPFSIVTGGREWLEPIQDHVRALGFGHLLSSVRCSSDNALNVMASGGEARRAFEDLLNACVRDGARQVLLAGGGFIGAAQEFRMDAGLDRIFDCGEVTARLMARIVDDHLDYTDMDVLAAVLQDSAHQLQGGLGPD